MRELILLSHVVNTSVNEGFIPAARKLGLRIALLSDCAEQQRHHFCQAGLTAYPDEIVDCDVFNPLAVIEAIAERPQRPAAVFSNSDHLQTSTAMAADYFDLPGKDWRVTYRAKNKAQMRAYLQQQGIDSIWNATVSDATLLARVMAEVPFPCVVKPREGVASEQVALARDADELEQYCASLWRRQPGQTLLLEDYLPGELYTLETLGDGQQLKVLGGFKVTLSAPPSFVELQANWGTGLTEEQQAHVVEQITRFGIRFGACHTEFVMTAEGPRLIEINYRSIGDRRDLLMQEALGIDYFGIVLRLHLGEPLKPMQLAARAAAIHYFTLPKEGRITNAPKAYRHDDARVSLRYEPLRKAGEHLALSHSNRDYLGVMSGISTDAALLNQVMDQHSASLNWEIQS